jgi:RHS repeat-associated protein
MSEYFRPGNLVLDRAVRWFSGLAGMRRLLIAPLLACLLLFGTQAGAETVYYHNDLLGSPVAATNASGHPIWRENYRPYGERLQNDLPSTNNEIWFSGRHFEADTGLSYMGARYYDTALGRFLSTDTVRFYEGSVHSFNRYAYANNNPYKYFDPDGNMPIPAPAPVGPIGGGFTVAGGVGASPGKPIADAAQGSLPGYEAAGAGAPSLPGFSANDVTQLIVTAFPSPITAIVATLIFNQEKKPELIHNPKHHPNSPSPEPANAVELFNNSIPAKDGTRWAKDERGVLHRFSKPSNGQSHWNGSTGGKRPIREQNVPDEIKKELKSKG